MQWIFSVNYGHCGELLVNIGNTWWVIGNRIIHELLVPIVLMIHGTLSMTFGNTTKKYMLSTLYNPLVNKHSYGKSQSLIGKSSTTATQNAGECRQVPRLPRKVPRRHRRLIPPKRATNPAQCHKCHTCHAKRRWMSLSATPATRSEGECHQAPRLPRKVPAKRRWMASCATPDTWIEGGCHQVPRLPRKVPRRHRRL